MPATPNKPSQDNSPKCNQGIKSYKWYTTYRANFKPQFQTYCDFHIGISVQKPPPPDRMLELLEETTYTIPQEPKFKKLCYIHNCFSIVCTPTLRLEKTPETASALKELKTLCDDIWSLFVRIATTYDDVLPAEYQNTENTLWDTVRDTERRYDNIIRKGALPLSDETESRVASIYNNKSATGAHRTLKNG